jgi:hypothetical protein|tara:strand:- start:721 stop:912 length:192 start_codon:yes stop_codon:yes gene_type:complete
MNTIKNQKQYIEKYIIPNESREMILQYYEGCLEYDNEYLEEHINYNEELTEENKKELIDNLNK